MPLSEPPTIEVKDLKTYFFTKGGIAKAVDGVSFSVGRGKVLGQLVSRVLENCHWLFNIRAR